MKDCIAAEMTEKRLHYIRGDRKTPQKTVHQKQRLRVKTGILMLTKTGGKGGRPGALHGTISPLPLKSSHLNMASFSLCERQTRRRNIISDCMGLLYGRLQCAVGPIPIKREREGAIEYN